VPAEHGARHAEVGSKPVTLLGPARRRTQPERQCPAVPLPAAEDVARPFTLVRQQRRWHARFCRPLQ
jgi:hypothetical protein